MRSILNFTIAVLAAWRLSHLLFAEDGPWSIASRLRSRAIRHARVFECFYCLSLWVALPIALMIARSLQSFLLDWFAVSGGAIMLERLTVPLVPAAVWHEETPPDQPD